MGEILLKSETNALAGQNGKWPETAFARCCRSARRAGPKPQNFPPREILATLQRPLNNRLLKEAWKIVPWAEAGMSTGQAGPQPAAALRAESGIWHRGCLCVETPQ